MSRHTSLLRIFMLITFGVMFFSILAEPAEAARRSRQQANSGAYCTISKRCAYFTIDASTGSVLEQMDADKKVYPASLTKLMTAYLLFDALERRQLNLSDRVRVSSHASDMPALKLGLRPGETISVEDALEAVTVRSANDAAVIIAEAIAGSEDAFARKMTIKAHELGMNRTQFRNASGLPDPNQFTTARDMAILAVHVLSDFPRYRRYFSMKEAYVDGRTIEGHNYLLRDGVVEGGKTGYIRDSGYNLVAWTEREGRLVIGSIFGGRSAAARDRRLSALLDSSYGKLRNMGLPAVGISQYTQAPLPRAKPSSIGEIIDSTSPGLSEAMNVTQPSSGAAPDPNTTELDSRTLASLTGTFSSSWAIQVGAYRDALQAQQALQAATRKIPSLLGGAYPRTLSTRTSLGELYRAQLIGLDERAARTACNVLTQQGMQCLTMPPSGQPS